MFPKLLQLMRRSNRVIRSVLIFVKLGVRWLMVPRLMMKRKLMLFILKLRLIKRLFLVKFLFNRRLKSRVRVRLIPIFLTFLKLKILMNGRRVS